MWRKTNEAKPSLSEVGTPPPSAVKTQETSQGIFQTRPQEAQSAPPFSATGAAAADLSPGASRIGPGLKIRGELSGDADLYIDGEAQGKIRITSARMTVGPAGRVQADIEASEIVVQGSLLGNLKATERVQLGSSSRTEGSVQAPRVAIDEGAKLRGKVETTRPGGAPGSRAPAPERADTLRPVPAHAEVGE